MSKFEKIVTMLIAVVFLAPFVGCTPKVDPNAVLLPIRENGKYGFMDITGRVVIKPQFDDASILYEGLAPVKKDGKWGYVDPTGKMVIEPQFEEDARCFKEGLARVLVNGKWGFIDKTGKWVVEPQYDDETPLEDGAAWVYLDGKWGLIDKTGKVIVEPEFEDYSDFDYYVGFDEKVACLEKHKFWGTLDDEELKLNETWIDKTGNVVEPHYDGLREIEKDGKWGLADEAGNVVVEPQFDDIIGSNEGLAWVEKGEKVGLIDKTTGRLLIEPQFEGLKAGYSFNLKFYEGLVGVKKDDKWGFVNESGEMVIKPQFEDIEYFREGMAGVAMNGKWGFIDKTGQMVIEPQFEAIESFSEGLAGVVMNGKWGFIDKTGQMAIEPQFDYNIKDELIADGPSFMDNGIARVKKDGKWGYVDKTGKMIVEPQFDGVSYDSEEGVIWVKKDGKKGIFDKTGKMIVEPQYDELVELDDFGIDMLFAEKDNKWAYIDKTGKFVWREK